MKIFTKTTINIISIVGITFVAILIQMADSMLTSHQNEIIIKQGYINQTLTEQAEISRDLYDLYEQYDNAISTNASEPAKWQLQNKIQRQRINYFELVSSTDGLIVERDELKDEKTPHFLGLNAGTTKSILYVIQFFTIILIIISQNWINKKENTL